MRSQPPATRRTAFPLRHVALAPATFGSPIAHEGRSWLGALFKSRRELGPDLLEAGNGVLDALEPGSRFTLDRAHRDLIGDEAVKFFYTFTTTLAELRLNREPLPLSDANRITGFLTETRTLNGEPLRR